MANSIDRSSQMWVFTVCLDLYVWKFRIIMAGPDDWSFLYHFTYMYMDFLCCVCVSSQASGKAVSIRRLACASAVSWLRSVAFNINQISYSDSFSSVTQSPVIRNLMSIVRYVLFVMHTSDNCEIFRSIFTFSDWLSSICCCEYFMCLNPCRIIPWHPKNSETLKNCCIYQMFWKGPFFKTAMQPKDAQSSH